MRLRLPALAAALAVALLGAPVAAAPVSATSSGWATTTVTEEEEAATTPLVEVTPAASGLVEQGGQLELDVTVTNRSDAALPPSTAAVFTERAVLTSRTDLAAWLDGTSTASPIRGGPVADVVVPELAAGQSLGVRVDVPAAAIGVTAQSPFGVHRLDVRLQADGGQVASGRSSFTTATEAAVPTVGLATVLPIVVPPSTTGVVSADLLATYTAPGGTLDRQLDDALLQPVALAVDPRIIASVRVLGSSAPPSALTWLDRLDAATNEIFPLAYADSDIAATSQAAGVVLAPTGFDVDPQLFVAPSASPSSPEPPFLPPGAPPDDAPGDDTPGDESIGEAPSEGDDGSGDDGASGIDGTPPPTEGTSPDEGAGTPVVPTTEQLLAWDYSVSGIAWPAASSVVQADLETFSDAGLTTTIVSSENTTAGTLETTPSAAATAGEHQLATSDSALSTLLSTAATAGSEQEWQAAMSELASTLAAVAGERTNRRPIDGRILLAALERDAPLGSLRLRETMEALVALPWVTSSSLSDALATEPVEVTVVDRPAAEERVAGIRTLLDSESAVSAFATVLEDPAVLTDERRLAALPLTSRAWDSTDAGWTTAVQEYVAASTASTGAVQVAASSNLNFLQDDGNLPITVSNTLDYPVTVMLRVRPSTGILNVLDDSVELSIEPDSQERGSVPVQSVANGEVSIEISLSSPSGVPVSTPTSIVVNVQAGWETAVTTALAGLLVVVFVLGIVRTVRRRTRAARGETVAEPAEPGEPGEDGQVVGPSIDTAGGPR